MTARFRQLPVFIVRATRELTGRRVCVRLLVPLAALGHAGRPATAKRPGVLAHRACGSRIAGLFGRRVARRVCLRPSALAGADHAPRLALAVQPHVHALFITRKVRRSAEAPRAWHPPDIGSAGPAPPLTTPHRRVAHRTFRTRLACVASHAPRALPLHLISIAGVLSHQLPRGPRQRRLALRVRPVHLHQAPPRRRLSAAQLDVCACGPVGVKRGRGAKIVGSDPPFCAHAVANARAMPLSRAALDRCVGAQLNCACIVSCGAHGASSSAVESI